jgi:hypothetical protein
VSPQSAQSQFEVFMSLAICGAFGCYAVLSGATQSHWGLHADAHRYRTHRAIWTRCKDVSFLGDPLGGD